MYIALAPTPSGLVSRKQLIRTGAAIIGMRRFKKILYVADPMNRGRFAYDRATALAKDNHAKLTVVDVVQRSERNDVLIGFEQADAVRQAAVELRAGQLEEMITPLAEQGIDAESVVLVGTPFYELIRKVLRDKHDLVVKDAHFRRSASRVPFDPIEFHLLRKCPCPVWINKPQKGKRFRRIMAAVDPDPTDPDDLGLNVQILDLACSIASWDGAEVHAVHAWDIFGEDLLSSFLGLRKRELERTMNEAQSRVGAQFDALISPYEGRDFILKKHLLKGHPEEILPGFARRTQIDLIVMGTVARTSVSGIFIGNTAEAVLDQVDCSYLTVKPDGFECPIGI